MLDVGIRIEHQGGWHYCSHECREEARWNAAKERGHVQTCQNCGTKFIRSSGSFCSRKCYNQAVKSGWKSQNPKPVKHIASEKACCSICGHEFIRPAGTEYPYCSPECRKIAFDNSRKKRKMQKVDAELKKRGLCWCCKTSYTDCERISSNFQYSPEGAVFQNNKIIRCPKFTQ